MAHFPAPPRKQPVPGPIRTEFCLCTIPVLDLGAAGGWGGIISQRGRQEKDRKMKEGNRTLYLCLKKTKQNLLFSWGEKIAPQGHLTRQNAEGKSQKNVHNG